MTEVTIIVPVYKNKLTKQEEGSLRQLIDILGNYPIQFVKPASLELAPLNYIVPQLTTTSFSDHYFDGIDGYNRLLLSEEFYQAFESSKYILIYQLDSWVFTDSLLEWCKKDYDYVGAPWIRRDFYDNIYVKPLYRVQSRFKELFGINDRIKLHNLVGNGGFSLRKVSSHLEVTKKFQREIESFAEGKRDNMKNEDVFWSYFVNNQLKQNFCYPNCKEALEFSFDIHPEYCLKVNNGRLPFGCHGWSKKKMLPFWREHISV